MGVMVSFTEKLRRALFIFGMVIVACMIGALVDGAMHPNRPANAPESGVEVAVVIGFVVSGFAFWVCAMMHAWQALRGRGAVRYWVMALLFGGNILASFIYWLFYVVWRRPVTIA